MSTMITPRVSQTLLRVFKRSYSATVRDVKPQLGLAMNKPNLYGTSNSIQRQHTLEFFKNFKHKMKWNKNGDTAIDLGCGDGGVSVMIKNSAPCKFKKFLCTDLNELMIQYASKHHSDEDISFRVMHIGDDIPKDLIGSFNHVFSFLALQWVKDQEKAFCNIYKLLTNEGDCFLTFVETTAIYDVYSVLSHHPKWKSWLHDVDMFISPYHNMEGPDRKVSELMKKAGFKNIEVQRHKLTSNQSSLEDLKDIVQAVEPFNMPDEVFTEFFEYYKQAGQEMGVVNINRNNKGEVTSVKYDYTLLVCFGNKY